MSIHACKGYIPAIVKENKEWYIEFGYTDAHGKMRRSRKYLNCQMKRLKTQREKRQYAHHIAEVINGKLRSGWTPDMDRVAAKTPRATSLCENVISEWMDAVIRQEDDGSLRHGTKLTYTSTINIFRQFLTDRQIEYVYQIDAALVRDWFDYSLHEVGLTPKTVKNYKAALRIFCSWCVDRRYMDSNPASEVAVSTSKQDVRKADRRKDAKYIDERTRARIFAYWEENDKYMLLACYLCYYCFIRPHEIMQLTVGLFSAHDSLLHIPADISKTHIEDWVTVPDKVFMLMLDLGILQLPTNYNLFDKNIRPGYINTPNRGDAIRLKWDGMRRKLGLNRKVVFYNLKHTGITDMMASVSTPRLVQLQARHQSLQQTEGYAQRPKPTANEEIRKIK